MNEITGIVSFHKETMPYNKLLTNLACSSRTGEYWPSVVFVRTSLRSVRTVTTSGQYSPVRPSRSVSKRLVFTISQLSILLVFLRSSSITIYKPTFCCVHCLCSLTAKYLSLINYSKLAFAKYARWWLELSLNYNN